MPPLKPAGASARPAARSRASASAKPAPRKKPAPRRKPALRIKIPPPPRAADPFAKKTGARLSYYTAEFLAEAKRRIETTLQSTTAIALDLGIDRTVLWRLVDRYGWVRPEGSLRLRGLSPAMRLAMEADLLAASPPPGGGRSTAQRSGGGESRSEQVHPTPALADARADPPPPGEGGSEPAASSSLDNSTIERLEAAVLKELATVETMRASLRDEPRRPIDAERTARTLSVLTETLAKLRRLRLGSAPQAGPTHDDDIPDIDEFRRDLARRIRALVASRTGGGSADGD